MKRLTVLNTAFSTQSNIQFLNALLTNPVTDSCHLFQSPDCKERVQVQRLLLNCPDIGKYTFYLLTGWLAGWLAGWPAGRPAS